MNTPNVPQIALTESLKRAAIAYGTIAGLVEGITTPYTVAVAVRWEDGIATVDIGDPDTAEDIARRWGLIYEASQSHALLHQWRGTVHGHPVIVIGRGRLLDTVDAIGRRAVAADRRRRDLLVSAAAGGYIVDVRG